MSTKTEQSGFLRFLKNEKFIEWKLFPTDELNTYWKNFSETHPEEKENLALAEQQFKKINLSSYALSQDTKEKAIKRLEESLRAYNRKRKIRLFAYMAAACAAALVLSVLYVQTNFNRSEETAISSADYIVGNALDSEDIRLITGNETTAFQENVDIEINHLGAARIKTEKESEKEVSIDKGVLNKLIVPYGKRSVLTLSDGSKIWLNSGSVLEFPARFSGEKREIQLVSGEMYIEVASDKKRAFYVHTSGFQVKVYGTRFNVSTYSGAPQSIVLAEGRVSLKSGNNKETFLSPDQQAICSDNGDFDIRKVNADQYISWKNGYLMFEDTPMPEVLKQIERYYNLSFNYDKDVTLKDITCTGKIILSDNMDNVMTTLALISSTKYKKENNKIYITNESL